VDDSGLHGLTFSLTLALSLLVFLVVC